MPVEPSTSVSSTPGSFPGAYLSMLTTLDYPNRRLRRRTEPPRLLAGKPGDHVTDGRWWQIRWSVALLLSGKHRSEGVSAACIIMRSAVGVAPFGCCLPIDRFYPPLILRGADGIGFLSSMRGERRHRRLSMVASSWIAAAGVPTCPSFACVDKSVWKQVASSSAISNRPIKSADVMDEPLICCRSGTKPWLRHQVGHLPNRDSAPSDLCHNRSGQTHPALHGMTACARRG